MKESDFIEQQYLQAFERSLRLIRNGERLSLEASIEELCKLLLLQIYLERASRTLNDFVGHLVVMDDDHIDYYHILFNQYGLGNFFRGWDYLKLKLSTLMSVVDELTHESLFKSEANDKARAFTEFLQSHYSGYLSEYSSPQLLNKYIMDVINPQQLHSMADPCCGLGGMLVEAINQSTHSLEIKGFDINQRMTNTANLQIMMYGYGAGNVECLDLMDVSYAFKDGPYEAIVSHLPNIRRTYVLAGAKSDYSSFPEDIYINHVLKMLSVNGIAALVISDDFLISEHREESRRWLYNNAQVLNITRFEGLAFSGGSNVRSYNIIFLRKQKNRSLDTCTTILFKVGTSQVEIEKVAKQLNRTIYFEDVDQPKNANIRFFNLSNEVSWNVNLLFAREKMGWRYQTCSLRELIMHDRERVKNYDSSRNYKQLTVRNRGLGVIERKEEYMGTESTNKIRFVAHGFQLIISAIDADKGAVGIVPPELDGALVSRNYYLFTIISQDIDPDYLVTVLSSEPVLRQLGFYKRGYVMSRFSLDDLLSLVIPLPSLEEQKLLVANLKKKVKQVQLVQNELEKEQKEFAVKLFGDD